MSCGIWPLSAGVNFEHVMVDLTPVSWLNVLLPSFPLSHEDGEDDVQLLARVKQEARNIVGGYTHMEHKACIASVPNNGCLNHVLKIAEVAYGPHPAPVSAEVLKKMKAAAIVKVLAQHPKVIEKNGAGFAKVSGSHASGGSKWPSCADIPPAGSVKLRKGTIPRAIASAAMACIMSEMRISKVLAGTVGAKAGGRHPGYKTVHGAKNAPSAKKCIILAIGVLIALSSEGTEESSSHDQAPEVQSKADPRDPSAEPQARSVTTSGPGPTLEVSLPIIASVGTVGALTGCFYISCKMYLYVKEEVLDPCLMLILGTRGVGPGAMVACEAMRDDDTALVDFLERVSCSKVSSLVITIVGIYVYLLSLFFRHNTWQNLRICSKSWTLQS
jgi:hypothetical protein